MYIIYKITHSISGFPGCLLHLGGFLRSRAKSKKKHLALGSAKPYYV